MRRMLVTLASGVELVLRGRECATLLEALKASGHLQHARSSQLDDEERLLIVGGAAYAFTPREFDLIRYLWHCRGHWVSRERLLRDVFGANVSYDPSLIRMHVLRIRRKLGPDASILRTDRVAGAMLALDLDDEVTNVG